MIRRTKVLPGIQTRVSATIVVPTHWRVTALAANLETVEMRLALAVTNGVVEQKISKSFTQQFLFSYLSRTRARGKWKYCFHFLERDCSPMDI
jgi:hypothetical protein